MVYRSDAVPSEERVALDERLKEVSAEQELETRRSKEVSLNITAASDVTRTVTDSLIRRKLAASAVDSAETAIKILEGRLNAKSD